MDVLTRERIAQFVHANQRIGATFVTGKGTYIRLWAPWAERAFILWKDQDRIALQQEDRGYYTGFFPDKGDGDRYYYILDDGLPIPDPASRFQPEGVSGYSQVVADFYPWAKSAEIEPFSQWVIYEIHTGAFSRRHDFSGIVEDLPRLKALGVSAIEIMPVAQFSGDKNWGYDGVFPHAVQNSYGGPAGLKMLVDSCHRHGIAVILDIVCNHIGPEGGVLLACGPYVQKNCHTPWGPAINYDGPESDEVRRYFLQGIWQWITEYRVDGLRFDAVQEIYDRAPVPFLEEVFSLKNAVEELRGQDLVMIAESDMNDPRLLFQPEKNGSGFDAQWADDLHHSLHAILTGERGGYYADYGTIVQLVRIYEDGVAFSGQYSLYRRRRHGRPYTGVDKKSLIVGMQNHDQIGNRVSGDRLSVQIDFEKLKLSAACIFLSPFTPFLFMGDEFFCRQKFSFFTDHEGDFDSCILHDRKFSPDSYEVVMTTYYTELIAWSKCLRSMVLKAVSCHEDRIILRYEHDDIVLVILSFSSEHTFFPLPSGRAWEILLRSQGFFPKTKEDVVAEIEIPPFSASLVRGWNRMGTTGVCLNSVSMEGMQK